MNPPLSNMHENGIRGISFRALCEAVHYCRCNAGSWRGYRITLLARIGPVRSAL